MTRLATPKSPSAENAHYAKDRLNGETRLYGVLGHPVAQSLSPAMHNAAFRATGLNAAYLPFPVAPHLLNEAVKGLVAVGVGGFNLTVPHKTAILPLLDEILPEARAVGAVNTVRNDNGRLIGANTDGVGLLASLEKDLAFTPHGKTVLMLGAGGAARGIAFALLTSGVGRLVIANRTMEKAEALAADCQTHFPQQQVDPAALDNLAGLAPHLLVQTTTVGMGDGKSPLDLEPLGVSDAVVDIIYHPLETPLLAQAKKLGLATCNGIGMLLYQGTAAWRFWTDREPPVEVMRKALLEAMG